MGDACRDGGVSTMATNNPHGDGDGDGDGGQGGEHDPRDESSGAWLPPLHLPERFGRSNSVKDPDTGRLAIYDKADTDQWVRSETYLRFADMEDGDPHERLEHRYADADTTGDKTEHTPNEK